MFQLPLFRGEEVLWKGYIFWTYNWVTARLQMQSDILGLTFPF